MRRTKPFRIRKEDKGVVCIHCYGLLPPYERHGKRCLPFCQIKEHWLDQPVTELVGRL